MCFANDTPYDMEMIIHAYTLSGTESRYTVLPAKCLCLQGALPTQPFKKPGNRKMIRCQLICAASIYESKE